MPPAVTDSAPEVRTAKTSVKWPSFLRFARDEAGVIGVLVVIVVGVGLFHPEFLRTGNLLSISHNTVYVGLMAAGIVFPLAMREVDLSVGGMYAMCMVVGALMIRDGVNTWLTLVAMLAIALIFGAVNGVITTYMRLPSFIVTLATSLLFHGLGLAFAQGKQITDLPQNDTFFTFLGGSVGGVPVAVMISAVLVAILAVVFSRTRFGARVRAIGSNPEAADFSGLPVARTRIAALALSGLMAGAAAVFSLAFFMAGDPTVGNGYELTAIAGAIIGGTPLAGGRGSVVGAVVGCLILSVVASALAFFQVPINWTTFATGAVILVAVAADTLLRRLRSRGSAGS